MYLFHHRSPVHFHMIHSFQGTQFDNIHQYSLVHKRKLELGKSHILMSHNPR